VSHRGSAEAGAASAHTLTAVDLFCGAGGMSVGLKDAGFSVIGAVDIDPLAIAAHRANHPDVRRWEQDIRTLEPLAMAAELGLAVGELDLLAGCPPCQGFSTVRTRRQGTSAEDPRNSLVGQFGRFAAALRPKALLLENVPGLGRDIRFGRLRAPLERLGYQCSHAVLDAADFGVPQRRRRFVMLALLGGRIELVKRTDLSRSVRDAIGGLEAPAQSTDALHNHGERRNSVVQRRIERVPHDGGSFRLLGEDEQLPCHKRTEQRPNPGFFDIYGRMHWDLPAPTLTGGCINPSKGRFLHPEQNRAITLREAALLQGFPAEYKLPLSRGKYRVAELIGNALPPAFVRSQAEVVARALDPTPS
jgi:DNA (cytosine-5)-methyltransferase 1